MDEEQVHVVRLQPLQALVQALGEVAALGLELGDQEDLLPGLGVAGEEAAVALLAQAVAVGLGRVPVGDAPFQRLLEEQLVVDGVEHAPQVKDGHLHPGLAQLAFGRGPGRGGRSLRLRGGEGPGRSGPRHGDPGQSHGLDKIPAGHASVFSLFAHDSHLLVVCFMNTFNPFAARISPLLVGGGLFQ